MSRGDRSFTFCLVLCFAIILVLTIFLVQDPDAPAGSPQESLWDLPTDTPGTYVRTDPDTDIEYIIVISDSGSVAVCPREGANDVC